MDEVKNKGGETHIFSSLHPTGTQLNGFTGIAAILFFPVLFNYEADDEDDISLSEGIFECIVCQMNPSRCRLKTCLLRNSMTK
jgi:hypothetical protein